MARKARFWMLMLGGTIVSLVLSLFIGTGSAAAKSCSGTYCVYEAQGWSGSGARGTGTNITLPYQTALFNTYDGIAGAAFLYSDQYTAIETGAVLGYTNICGFETSFHPYATLNNGSSEDDNCNYQLSELGTYQVQSFVHNGLGFSSFNSQYGTPLWEINWGGYNITGDNETQTEIHANNDVPQFSSCMCMTQEQWYNGSNWYSWGYTNAYSDCPYHAVWVSNTSWKTYDSGC